jgi:hypothetical protein
MGTVDAMEFLLHKLKYSKTNQDFFYAMNTCSPDAAPPKRRHRRQVTTLRNVSFSFFS